MRSWANEKSMFYGADSKTFETAAQLRRNMTLPELILWKRLRDRKLFKTRFRRQHPVNTFIVDFYCHEYKLVIEIDGEIHNQIENREYDDGRACELEKFDLKIIRFTNDQVMFNTAFVIKQIQKIISELSPLQGAVTPWA
ncbi:MAG: endonuclease domain-containing protein [Bacteroidales bacterium]|jgi:very-short-patch-repair endonuclease|nr:endonuclease domain-containing protein [Bacteroidales bacterium]